MTILEQLRERQKTIRFEDKQAIAYFIEECLLLAENLSLKLKNRSVEISDLKHRAREVKTVCQNVIEGISFIKGTLPEELKAPYQALIKII